MAEAAQRSESRVSNSHLLLPGDKVLRRETRSANQVSLIHLLERNGKIVAVADQVIWKMID